MNAQLTEDAAGGRSRRWRTRRRAAAAVAGTLLAAGAFLAWGPVGLGNGPLNAGVYASQGWADVAREPAGFIIPMQNSGSAPAVIDAVQVFGGTRYGSPHVLALRVLTMGNCGGAWPARRTSRGFELSGCGGPDTGALIGRAVGATGHSHLAFPAAAMAAPPAPGTCWVMTKIVVHYHVGIRHYTATDPYQLAVCSGQAMVDTAMNAAESSR